MPFPAQVGAGSRGADMDVFHWLKNISRTYLAPVVKRFSPGSYPSLNCGRQSGSERTRKDRPARSRLGTFTLLAGLAPSGACGAEGLGPADERGRANRRRPDDGDRQLRPPNAQAIRRLRRTSVAGLRASRTISVRRYAAIPNYASSGRPRRRTRSQPRSFARDWRSVPRARRCGG
jgi:hypothetical protein